MKLFSYDIRFDTFFKKGVKVKEDKWGVYCITGFQGSGKTYFGVYMTMALANNYKIYTNIKSFKPKIKTELEYFSNLEEITDNVEENCLFLIDEISKKYTKNSQQDKKLYSWLQQSRKRGRIVILITQEWKEVPMWLRRPVRYLYTTHKIPFFPLFHTTIGDALNCTYNIDTNEWECPIIEHIIYKRIKKIAELYDTFEPVETL